MITTEDDIELLNEAVFILMNSDEANFVPTMHQDIMRVVGLVMTMQNDKLTKDEWNAVNKKLETIAKDKETQLSEAKFPIKKLSFDEDGVIFDGIPFDQCSTAQQIKISVAMGLVMNPKLRVLLIREGSLLDAKNLEMIAKMAKKADAQIWIERVSKGEECQVIIEDGSVVKEAVTSG